MGVYYYVGVWKSNISLYCDVIVWLIGCYVIDFSYNVKLNNVIIVYNLI